MRYAETDKSSSPERGFSRDVYEAGARLAELGGDGHRCRAV
jgi:hypothetical protein